MFVIELYECEYLKFYTLVGVSDKKLHGCIFFISLIKSIKLNKKHQAFFWISFLM